MELDKDKVYVKVTFPGGHIFLDPGDKGLGDIVKIISKGIVGSDFIKIIGSNRDKTIKDKIIYVNKTQVISIEPVKSGVIGRKDLTWRFL